MRVFLTGLMIFVLIGAFGCSRPFFQMETLEEFCDVAEQFCTFIDTVEIPVQMIINCRNVWNPDMDGVIMVCDTTYQVVK